jgi:hypothetical protein
MHVCMRRFNCILACVCGFNGCVSVRLGTPVIYISILIDSRDIDIDLTFYIKFSQLILFFKKNHNYY